MLLQLRQDIDVKVNIAFKCVAAVRVTIMSLAPSSDFPVTLPGFHPGCLARGQFQGILGGLRICVRGHLAVGNLNPVPLPY